MRIGLAGAGRIGVRHAGALCALPEVDGLVIADAEPARARGLAGRLARGPGTDVRAVDGVEALFGTGTDAVVVAAPTDVHADLVVRAVTAGLPVFCEKPLAADLAGTLRIAAAARAAGVPVQVGFQRRFDAGNLAAREALASGRIGWLHTVRSCSFDPAPPPAAYVPSSGGLFRDCLIHDLDLVRFVTGREVRRVMASGANRGAGILREYGDVDTGSALLDLDDGTLGVVSATRFNAAGYDARLELFGSRGCVAAGLDERTPVAALPGDGGGPPDPYGGFLERFSGAYDAEMRVFADVVAGRRANPCPPEEALEAFRLAVACETSLREGRAVGVAEVRP